jgi:hypothetical protein
MNASSSNDQQYQLHRPLLLNEPQQAMTNNVQRPETQMTMKCGWLVVHPGQPTDRKILNMLLDVRPMVSRRISHCTMFSRLNKVFGF